MSKAYYYSNVTLLWGIGIGILAVIFAGSIIVEMDNLSLAAFLELRRLKRLLLILTPAVIYYTIVYAYRKLAAIPVLLIDDLFIEICTRFRPRRIEIREILSCQIVQHEKANSIFEYGYHKEKKRERLEIVYNKGGTQKTFKIRPAFIGGDVGEAVALINAKILNSDEIEPG